MFSNSSLIFYGLLLVFAIFIGIYVWRRIYMLESYTNILEKKVLNMKKENKELQDLLHNGNGNGNDCCTFETADTIMNKIFNIERPKVDEPSVINISVASTTPQVVHPVASVQDDTKIILDDVDKDLADVIGDLPVAKHIDEPERDVEVELEVESVVSTDNSNIYNRKKLSKMNLDKLKEICVSLNISTEGTKNNLIDRILS